MKIFTSEDISQAMRDAGVLADTPLIADRYFAYPMEDWARYTLAPALDKFFRQYGLASWEPERHDCDDFARGAAWFASALSKHSIGRAEAALAFGEYWYMTDHGFAHAINVFITEGNKVVFFEPQAVIRNANPIVRLSLQERMQCSAYRF